MMKIFMNNFPIIIVMYTMLIPLSASAMPYVTDSVGSESPSETDTTRESLKSDPQANKVAEKRLTDVRELGYFESLQKDTLCDGLLYQMKMASRYAKRNKLPINMNTVGYMNLSDYEVNKHSFHIPTVDSGLIKPHSRNYINPDKTQVTRIYTRTVFGPLLILHMMDGPGFLYPPEFAVERFIIDGDMADVFIEKHKSPDKWSTTITLSSDDDYYRIEAGRKLEGRDLTRFMQFAKGLIEKG